MIAICSPQRTNLLNVQQEIQQTLAKDLSSDAETATDDLWTLDLDKDRIRRFIGTAFAGNEKVRGEPTFMWITKPCREKLSEEQRVHAIRFMISFAYMEDLNRSSFQLCSESPEGIITSAVSVQEYDAKERAKAFFPKLRHSWEETVTTFRLLVQYKESIPALFQSKDLQDDSRRLEKMAKGLKFSEWHCMYGPKGSHWYVHLVGVNPACQGQGKGKLLMQKLNELADGLGQAMYLEAGEGNRVFYEKMGFVVQHTETLVDEAAPDDEPYLLHLMTREPNTATESTQNDSLSE